MPRAGRGEVIVTARAGELAFEERLDIVVSAKVRAPLTPTPTTAHASLLEAYAARGRLHGWVGFGGSWADVTARVTPMLQDLVAALRSAMAFPLAEVRVQTSTFETLTFETPLTARDATWAKIEAELMRGGTLRLLGMNEGCWNGDGPTPMVTIELTHNRDGGVSGGPPTDFEGKPIDLPRVTLAWSTTAPETAEGRARIAEISRRVLLDAGHVAGQLGGYVSGNENTYELLAGTRRSAEKQAWLAEHVRMPAWCVLAPSVAATRLGAPASERVRATRTTHGLFAWSTAADPFVYADEDAEAMERFVLPAIGAAEN
jgi:hypothetical protein